MARPRDPLLELFKQDIDSASLIPLIQELTNELRDFREEVKIELAILKSHQVIERVNKIELWVAQAKVKWGVLTAAASAGIALVVSYLSTLGGKQ